MAVAGEDKDLFNQAVSAVLREWQALRIAVDNMFGGAMSKEKALWMEDVTVHFICNNDDVQPWELEDYLYTIMDQEFHTIIDDASLPMISKKICQLYAQCGNGETSDVREFILSRLPAKPMEVQCVRQESLEDQIEDVSEDVSEDDEDKDITVENGLEQLHMSEKRYPSSEQNEVEEREEDVHYKENGDDDGWEVVRSSRRKSKSSA